MQWSSCIMTSSHCIISYNRLPVFIMLTTLHSTQFVIYIINLFNIHLHSEQIHIMTFTIERITAIGIRSIWNHNLKWFSFSFLISIRFYDICAEEQLPGEARTILKLLQSDAMFLLLSTVTGIALHELATTSDDEGEEGTSSGNGSSSSKQWLTNNLLPLHFFRQDTVDLFVIKLYHWNKPHLLKYYFSYNLYNTTHKKKKVY